MYLITLNINCYRGLDLQLSTLLMDHFINGFLTRYMTPTSGYGFGMVSIMETSLIGKIISLHLITLNRTMRMDMCWEWLCILIGNSICLLMRMILEHLGPAYRLTNPSMV